MRIKRLRGGRSRFANLMPSPLWIGQWTSYDQGLKWGWVARVGDPAPFDLPGLQRVSCLLSCSSKSHKIKVKVKEADLYSAFIEVPYTQGAQVRITQCYLQITPYLPLPRKHSPDGASQTEVADI